MLRLEISHESFVNGYNALHVPCVAAFRGIVDKLGMHTANRRCRHWFFEMLAVTGESRRQGVARLHDFDEREDPPDQTW